MLVFIAQKWFFSIGRLAEWGELWEGFALGKPGLDSQPCCLPTG